MRKPKYYETQKEVLERKKALLKQYRVSKNASQPEKETASSQQSNSAPATDPADTISRDSPSWKKLRSGASGLKYFSRACASQELKLQPCANSLVNTILDAACEGGVHLCLVWPARVDSLALLHGMASLERNFSRDLRGMRSVLFPGTNDTRNALQHVLVDRERYSNLFRSLWVNVGGKHELRSHTYSESFQAALSALNDIRTYHPEVANPSLGELVPCFLCRQGSSVWTSVATIPLERSLKKVEKLAHRRDVRGRVESEWGDPEKAPGALMVMHFSTRKDSWKKAFIALGLHDRCKPEVILLDATSRAENTDYNSVRRIPDFLRLAYDSGLKDVGSVVITDDPKTFFVLRSRLGELKLHPEAKVWVAESEDEEAILSPNPLPADWMPQQRSNANFNVHIVDRDASQIALALHRLARESGSEESASHQAIVAACLYVLRLSNLPAGYLDLTAESADGVDDYSSQRNAWTTIKLGLRAVLQSGILNHRRGDAEKAFTKTEELIDAWTDATPMAGKLLAAVQKSAMEGHDGLSIVLPNKKYIRLAHRFLQRKLKQHWVSVEPRLDWHTLSSVSKTLTGEHERRNFLFVGVNRNVLRLLVTHPDIPHGTTVLFAYSHAESLLTTLNGLKDLEALKPYRGRLGLLAQQLDRRLKEIPSPLSIGKLGEMRMTFTFESARAGTTDEQVYYKFELEGGRAAYASSRLYRYNPNEDPFFQATAASSVAEGDFIFEMSDDLRGELESVLDIESGGLGSVIYPERAFLRLYHNDVKNRCELLFKATSRRSLAREIHTKMVEIDKGATACRLGRVYYWLALQAEGDTRPHAPKDAKFFKLFCKALQIDEEEAIKYWNFIRNARRLNQNLGRELSARYAEILFQPESASIYRKIPEAVVKRLQQQALRCVYRVERVVPPIDKTNPQSAQLRTT